ncbi:MAG: formylglycine-generating enzyme family protein [Gammaproteobacteria bacterium]|nr:formylglycine-generating enzyme family protein [Gammaproteobacteria bacterium]
MTYAMLVIQSVRIGMDAMSEDKPGLTLRLGDGTSLSMCWIPRGEFRMGSRGKFPHEEPAHRVRITRAFYLGTYPVTQAQYALCDPGHKNDFHGEDERPVDSVSWDAAHRFCEWLQARCAEQLEREGLSGHRFDLPSEAQWEYACRAGGEGEYHSGDGEAALAEVGWFDGNSQRTTWPVGQKRANAFGLYDMHGNVWEWCRDAWDADAYRKRVDGVCDPEVTARMVGGEDPGRVVRGGGWGDTAAHCRAADRVSGRPSLRGRYLGFRVGLFPGPSSAG